MTAYFISQKINTIIARIWGFFLTITGIKALFFSNRTPDVDDDPKKIDIQLEDDDDDLYVERIRIEKMKLRRASKKKEMHRNIYVKHFRNIPMADMEIALPEKKNPGLTPMDWVKFIVSAVIGLVTVISSLSIPKVDVRVIFAILSSVVGYGVKTYFTFQDNLVAYQNLITKSVYDKQLDSGRGTLLHLSDDVIQQEVKEVILSFFVLMEQGKASRKELDRRCEELIRQQFSENCNFDVDDAVQKLEKLGIVTLDTSMTYECVDLRQANDIIGTTTEEVVLKAKEGNRTSSFRG